MATATNPIPVHTGNWTQDEISKSYKIKSGQTGESAPKYRTATQKKAQEKDDDQMMFLKMLMTELKYQDPSKPMDTEKMATTMSQQAQVDRMNQMNEHMVEMVDMYKRDSFIQASGYIGKKLEVKDETGNGIMQPDGIEYAYTVPSDAASLNLVMKANGKVVFQADGETNIGHHIIKWDGVDKNNNKVPAGSVITFEVFAKEEDGSTINVVKTLRGTASSVSMVDSQPMINIGQDGASSPIPAENVVSIGEQQNNPTNIIANKLNNLAIALQPQTPQWLMQQEAQEELAQETSTRLKRKHGRNLYEPSSAQIQQRMSETYASQVKLRQQAMEQMQQNSINDVAGGQISSDGHSVQRNGGSDPLSLATQGGLLSDN